jgi:hypothetical protein
VASTSEVVGLAPVATAEIAPHVPMGGIKCPGIGVEFGEEGLAAYTSIKIINAAA